MNKKLHPCYFPSCKSGSDAEWMVSARFCNLDFYGTTAMCDDCKFMVELGILAREMNQLDEWCEPCQSNIVEGHMKFMAVRL